MFWHESAEGCVCRCAGTTLLASPLAAGRCSALSARIMDGRMVRMIQIIIETSGPSGFWTQG